MTPPLPQAALDIIDLTRLDGDRWFDQDLTTDELLATVSRINGTKWGSQS